MTDPETTTPETTTAASDAVAPDAAAASESPPVADSADATESLGEEVQLLEKLKTVVDPELMINIVDLGLIYSVQQEDDKVNVEMTLTSPACPAGPQIMQQAKMALETVEGVTEAHIKLVMSPPWTPERMTDDARDQLGIF